MDERKTLQAMLKAYQNEQKDLLTQAEQRLEVSVLLNQPKSTFNLTRKSSFSHSLSLSLFTAQEYTTKLYKVKDVQKEIQNHLKNLPDLTQLPNVTDGLAPLPSAGDLFNVH